MTEPHFRAQIQRMVKAYGPQGDQAYNSERCQIIFREMQDLTDAAFTRIVTELIGSKLRPPLIEEFREAAAGEREREAQRLKAERRRDALDFFRGDSLPDDEVKMLMGMIQRRMAGGYTDEEWAKISETINGLAKRSAS